MYRDRVTLRRLRVIVAGLPATSRLKTVMRQQMRDARIPPTPVEDLPPETWSETDWHLAAVRDLLARLIWLYLCTHREPRTAAPDEPEPVPRPGVRRRRRLNPWIRTFLPTLDGGEP